MRPWPRTRLPPVDSAVGSMRREEFSTEPGLSFTSFWRDDMRHIFAPVLAALLLLGASPVFAKTDCRADLREFDAAVKTTNANSADVQRAMKLRKEASYDCTEKGGSAKGDADMQQALKLIGIR